MIILFSKISLFNFPPASLTYFLLSYFSRALGGGPARHDLARPFRTGTAPRRRTLARGADREVGRALVRRRADPLHARGGDEARRGALLLPDAVRMPAGEAGDDLHLHPRARPQVRPRVAGNNATLSA